MKRPLLYSRDAEFEELALQSLRDGETGAEWGVLERLVSVVLSGKSVDPNFQAVVNAIVAKVVVSGKLPGQRRGRPPLMLDGADGARIADRYLELTDGGMNSADAIEQVAVAFPKDDGTRLDDRHIRRLVAENRPWLERRMGTTADDRNLFRGQAKDRIGADLSAEDAEFVARIMAQVDELTAVLTTHCDSEARRDYVADLDRVIANALKPK